ncbi:MAG: DNA topoisomerase I [Candidatus Asgardarchaeia archaeon]
MTRVALVIAEKPTAAKRIAEAFAPENNVKEIKKNGHTYYEVTFSGSNLKYIILPALGHIFSLKQKTRSWTYPIFDTHWVPIYEAQKTKSAKKIRSLITLFKELSQQVDFFISACDYDIEGSLIAYLILKEAIGEHAVNNAQRAKFSTLTKKDLRNAFANLLPTLNFNLIEAGLTRHEVDWLFGINLTRALTLSIKNSTNNFKILSTGRVQGPTLSFVVEREKEINTFIPTPFWNIKAQVIISKKKYELTYFKKKISSEYEASEIVNTCKGKNLKLREIKEQKRNISRPNPFNLSKLQSEAYRLFGFTPSRTLRIAESLYLSALISYPRTSSEKIPVSIDIRSIVKDLSNQPPYADLASKLLSKKELLPNNGSKDDPAHPAIHPTGTSPEKELRSDERKVYDLIVKNFLATISEDAAIKTYKAIFEYKSHIFYLTGREILNLGWIEFYKPYYKLDVQRLPSLEVGQEIPLHDIAYSESFTSPPPRYNPASLLKIMEKNELGTKATRAGIIDTLYKRGYIRNNRIEITPLASSVIKVLETYCPEILSPELTRQLEQKMNEIENGKNSREKIIMETKNFLTAVLNKIKRNENEIGTALYSALEKYYGLQRDLGKCPNCSDGRLILIKSKKTGKRYVACSNYFKEENRCETILPISQKGTIISTGKTCTYCGYPVVKIMLPGKRPFRSCLNWINCESNKRNRKK